MELPPELANLTPPRVRPLWTELDQKSFEEEAPEAHSFSDFEFVRFIGSGVIGTVLLVRCKANEKLYAMKLVPKAYASETPQRRKRMMFEQQILSEAKHPFIGRLRWSFQTLHYLVYVMDYYSRGTLTKLQLKQPKFFFSEKAVRFFASQVVIALEKVHRLGFIYRDVKTENLVFSDDGYLVLIDFGYAKQCATPELLEGLSGPQLTARVKKISPALSFVGTSQYVAPEVIDGTKQTSAVDWWSFGILLFQLLFGETPFRDIDMESTFEKIKKSELRFPNSRPLSRECKSLVRSLLARKASERLGANGAKEVMAHPFFRGVDWRLRQYMERPPAYSLDTYPKPKEEAEDEEMDPKDKAALDDFLKADMEILFPQTVARNPELYKDVELWEHFDYNVSYKEPEEEMKHGKED